MLVKNSITNRTSLPAVVKSLDAGMMRSKTIANNLANINTKGYERIEVTFEEQLREAIDEKKIKGDKTHKTHMDIGRRDLSKVNPEAYKPNDPTLPSNVNNVDIDLEAAKLAENQLLFNFGTKFIQQRMGAIQAAIKSESQR